jgi:hypothetical protein
MFQPTYTIRNMTHAELSIPLAWAAAEGWNPGLHDAVSFYVADSGGFLLGLLGDEPVATISVVKYGASFGFLGFYIVRPEYRGQGYGIQIWRAGLASLVGRNVGLDGVVTQQENYRKSGFVRAYANVRYQGVGSGKVAADAAIVPLGNLRFDDVYLYDRFCFPWERTHFLRSWIGQPGSVSLGLLADGRLTGYGVLRPCIFGYKIGPLFADDASAAEHLFVALSGSVPQDAPIFLDVPTINPGAVALAERHGMRIVFETARMYTQENPSLPMDRLFGVTSFELG